MVEREKFNVRNMHTGNILYDSSRNCIETKSRLAGYQGMFIGYKSKLCII